MRTYFVMLFKWTTDIEQIVFVFNRFPEKKLFFWIAQVRLVPNRKIQESKQKEIISNWLKN